MRDVMSYCPACGCENPPVLRYCLRCRNDLEGAPAPVAGACPGCAMPCGAGARFCCACGAKLTGPRAGVAAVPSKPGELLDRVARLPDVDEDDPRGAEELAREVEEHDGLEARVERSAASFRVVLRERPSSVLRNDRLVAVALPALFGAVFTFFAGKLTAEVELSAAALAALWLPLALGWGLLGWFAAAQLLGRRTVEVGAMGVRVAWAPVPWPGLHVPLAQLAGLQLSPVKVGGERQAGTRTVFDLELLPRSGGARTLLSKHEHEPLVLAALLVRCLRGHGWTGSLGRM